MDCGSIPGRSKSFFLSPPQNFQTDSGARPDPFQFVSVKWPMREAYHSPLSSVYVKNEWSYTSFSWMPARRARGLVYLYVSYLY